MQSKTLAAVALIFVVFYNLLFFRTQLGIGIALLYFLLNLFFFLVRNKKTNNLNYAISSSIVATIFAFLSAFRSNEIVQLIDLFQASLFSAIALFFYKYENHFQLTLPNFLLIPLSVATQTLASLDSLFDLFEKKDKNALISSDKKLTIAIIKGATVSFILVGVLLLLLTRGDLIFGQIVNDFLSTIWERLIVSLLVFVVLITFGLSKINKHLSLFNSEVSLNIGKFHELTIIIGSIIVLFTIFITIQFRYLFLPVGETELSQIGITSSTYSEYVRAGFNELLIVATIALAVIIYVSRYIHKLIDKQKWLIQLLTSILILENGLILASATKRLFLYADAHGLTRAREFGFVFLIWVASILIILLVSILYKINRKILTKMVLGSTLLILVGINLVNMDQLIVTKYKPTVNGEVDYLYLMSLSDDGFESWTPAVDEAEKLLTELNNRNDLLSEDYRKFTLSRLSLERLYKNHIEYLQGKYDPLRKWQSFNLSEYFAYQHIRKSNDVFKKVPKLLYETIEIDKKFSDQVKINTRLDRAIEAPLTPK